jgi:hypothetical protein
MMMVRSLTISLTIRLTTIAVRDPALSACLQVEGEVANRSRGAYKPNLETPRITPFKGPLKKVILNQGGYCSK